MRTLLVLAAVMLLGCLEPLPSAAAPQPSQAEWVCSPSTCSGCCKNNQCLGGNTELSCGIGGARCAACAEQQKCVSPGMCVWVDPVTGARLPDGTSPGSDPRQPGGSTQKCITLGSGQVICN